MRLFLSIPDKAVSILDQMMQEDMQKSRSEYLTLIIGHEKKRRDEADANLKRSPGRPKRGDADAGSEADAMPDEHEKRTLPLPPEYKSFVPLADRKKKVNEYDLLMLEEKRKSHEAQSE